MGNNRKKKKRDSLVFFVYFRLMDRYFRQIVYNAKKKTLESTFVLYSIPRYLFNGIFVPQQ